MVPILKMGTWRLRWGWGICPVSHSKLAVEPGQEFRCPCLARSAFCSLQPIPSLPQDHMQVHQFPLILSALQPHHFSSNSSAFLQTLSEVSTAELYFNYFDSDQTEGCPHTKEFGGPNCIGQLEYLSLLFN